MIAIAIAYASSSLFGAAAMALGIVGAAANLAATWGIIRLGAKYFASEETPRWGSAFLVAAFYCKLPLFIGLGYLAFQLGDLGRPCFLSGVGLVYLLLVGRVLALG